MPVGPGQLKLAKQKGSSLDITLPLFLSPHAVSIVLYPFSTLSVGGSLEAK